MFAPRPSRPRYPLLKAYLDARPTAPIFPQVDRVALASVAAVSGATAIGAYAMQGPGFVGAVLASVGIVLGFKAYRAKPLALPTPEQELSRRADGVANQLKGHYRLHRALHPAVAATLEECAGYWARIVAALEEPRWRGEDAAQWVRLREEALLSARLAMDEAIVHAGTTLVLVPPPRPLDHVSDALEDVGFGPLVRDGREREPMPASFRPVRELAERLRELAGRCETAATQRREASAEPISAAFRHLDATLGEMRQLEEAEGELRQGA